MSVLVQLLDPVIKAVVAFIPILRVHHCIERLPLCEVPLFLLRVNLAIDRHLAFFRLFECRPKLVAQVIQLAEKVWMRVTELS